VRANEFISEGRIGSIQDDVAKALPATYSLPQLKNQDPYLQYRFGVAIAGAKGRKQREKDNVPPFYSQSVWGENEIVVSFDPSIELWLRDAMNQMGITELKRIGTLKSEETTDVDKRSPINGFRGYE